MGKKRNDSMPGHGTRGPLKKPKKVHVLSLLSSNMWCRAWTLAYDKDSNPSYMSLVHVLKVYVCLM